MTKKILLWSTLWHSITKKNLYYDPLYDTLWPKTFLTWSTLTDCDPKNLYYDPLWHTLTKKISNMIRYDTLRPKKISNMIHSMTHSDQKISSGIHSLTNYDQINPIMIHSMTHYDPKKIYYDPLWPTMTQKFIIAPTMTHYDTNVF